MSETKLQSSLPETDRMYGMEASYAAMKSILVTLFICLPMVCAGDPVPKAVSDVGTEATPAPAKKPGIVGSSWLVEDIENKGVIDNARTFIHFDAADKVSGSGGINRFSGPCTLDGEKLGFGALRVTRMAGAPALMNQEAAFFAALAKVRSFKLDENDLLYFHDANGHAILRMSRSDEK